MKRMLVPALALGMAFALAKPAWAGHLFDGLRHGDGCCEQPCKPACPKPACEPCKPKCFSLCKPSCPKPCEPACPKPCDDACGGGCNLGGHPKGMFTHSGHRDSGCNSCSSCGGSGSDMAPMTAPAPAPAPAQTRSRIDSDYGPRLEPIPSNQTSRTTRRGTSF